MKEKRLIFTLLSLVIIISACVTYQPQPPSFYFEPLAPEIVTPLSLEDRLTLEEAWKFIQDGYPEKAQKLLAKLSPETPFYHLGLGYTAYLQGDLATAKSYFQAAWQRQPSLYLASLGLAQISQEEGDEEATLSYLREVLKIKPNHAWALSEYESLRKKKTKENISLARAALKENNPEKARQALLKSLYYSPESIEANLLLGDLYLQENNYNQALVHLQTVAQQQPDNLEILEKYGNLLFLTKNYKKSLEIYQHLQQLKPKDKKIKEAIENIKNRLGIFELPSQFEKIPTLDALKKEDLAALIAIKFKDYLEKPSEQPPILIDIATSWAAKFIIATASIGLLDVYPNHTFQPQKIVSRAEFAEAVHRLINYLEKKGYRFVQQIPPEKIKIVDVNPHNYYYQPILMVLAYDIMTLNQEKMFVPERPVTGNEAIKTLNIILNLIR